MSITLSGRRLALLGAGLAAIVAVAIVATILLTGNNKNNTAAGTSSTSATTTTTATGATGVVGPVEVGFAGVVPTALLKFCTTVAPSAGASATVDCKPPADTGGHYYPNDWTMSLYATDAALHKAYNDVRTAANVGLHYGQCNGISWGGQGTWAHGPGKPGGSRLCYFDGNVAVVAWTHEKLGQPTHIDLLGIARSDGSDHSDLFNWYRFWHHRVGKCDEPDCVAKL